MSDDTTALVLALATENAELRAELAEARELLIEAAVDASEMHAEVEALRMQIANLLIDRVGSTTQA
ncbi:hypothetical protein MKK68_08285 [Methylobacterium sp. E-016]|uniref:hypothetical protein n=1 Tax=Methylobacterium sp. E-016 TaxID=2836556 RepID=UPI001FBBBCE6|nr:hypothetical protein [Methylobacterium sp. E-016]MCJ2075650.1 hypothetical protein [Methylobacterium sp. E-016]